MLAADADLEVGPGLAALARPHLDHAADAELVERLERRDVEDAVLEVAGKNAASTSSREKPHAIWVRSLVPKEKNSADAAIRSARNAARGSSIMVPTLNASSTPRLALHLLGDRR